MNLKYGDTIGITCPSGYVSKERVAYAQYSFEQWGFKTILGKTVGNEYNYFSGDDATRAKDLQWMLDDPNINAIVMGRGGYGLSRIIDNLDFTAFIKNPKWICGFSDITVLHSHIHSQFQIPTIHGPMCGAIKPETESCDYIQNLKHLLLGESLQYVIKPCEHNKLGNAEGVLIGGNLAMLTHLTGSVSQLNTNKKILFLEEIGEHLYQIDRMLLNLKRSGQLDNLAALILGGFTDIQDTERPFGQTIEQIVLDKVAEFNYPVCFNFPSGHDDVNYPFVLGKKYNLSVQTEGVILKMCTDVV